MGWGGVLRSWAPNSEGSQILGAELKTGDLAPQAKILGNLDQTEAENASKRGNSGLELKAACRGVLGDEVALPFRVIVTFGRVRNFETTCL